jgi:hypothetical protein
VEVGARINNLKHRFANTMINTSSYTKKIRMAERLDRLIYVLDNQNRMLSRATHLITQEEIKENTQVRDIEIIELEPSELIKKVYNASKLLESWDKDEDTQD